MNKFSTLSTYSALILSAFLITSCGSSNGGDDNNLGGGSSGYTGSTEPASVTDSNAEALGVDATEAAAKAIEADSADSSGIPFAVSITGTTSPSQQVQDINQHILESLKVSNLPLGLTLTGSDFTGFSGYCGGSITVPDSFASGGNSADGTITYNNFCMEAGSIYGQLTTNGSVTISGGALSSYSNFTSSFSNGTVYSCNGPADSLASCSTNTVYTGTSGSSFMISDVNVSGDSFSGYNVDAQFCNVTYGCLTIATTSPVVFDCSNGKPSTGTITFTSDEGSNGSINFDSCTSYTITYSTSAGGAVNTISGTW